MASGGGNTNRTMSKLRLESEETEEPLTHKEILDILTKTNSVFENVYKQYAFQLKKFKTTFALNMGNELSQQIIHFLQYTVWVYLKIKFGIYSASDPYISHVLSKKSNLFKHTDMLNIPGLKLHLEKQGYADFFQKFDQLYYTKCCFNYLQYYVQEIKQKNLYKKVSPYYPK